MDRKRFAATVSELLLTTGAVSINTIDWFVYTSGIRSPIYCDMRWLISFTKERNEVLSCLTLRLADELAPDSIDVIAGVATAGIPYAAWLADRLGKSLVYVRESGKSHGKRQQIEGRLLPEQRTLVVEDLFTTGKSALQAVDTLRGASARVTHCLAIFEYGLSTAQRAFTEAGVSPITLCSIGDLLETARSNGRLSETERHTVEVWLSEYARSAK